MTARPLRILASVTSTFAMVAAGIAVTTSAAPAAVGDDPCPLPYNVGDLVPGVSTVTGLTTVKGTTPEEFHGTYVGTIENGIAPGLDLPVFDMKGSRITHADGTVDAGIWAGMSGSPVYDDATGKLVGAVSYGFSAMASPRAGVTPATYLYDLNNPKYATLSAAKTTVRATAQEATAIASASDEPGALGVGHIIRPSKQVTGVAASRANEIAAKSPLLQQKAPFKSSGFRAGGSSLGADADYPIQVGGNIATTFSTGDVTTAAVGTVTAICGDKVFAFGHPDEFSGKSIETFNGASAVVVQEDGSINSSYKISNVGAVKGVITQDRLAGIMGTLGQQPNNIEVLTHATGLGDTRDASTDVAVPEALPYVVSSQVYNDAVTLLNQYSTGDALMSWKISYIRKIGGVDTPQTFQRSQRYSTVHDFPEEVSYDAASDVEALLANGFEKIKVTKVEVTSAYLPDYRAFKPVGAQYYTGGVWKNISSSTAIKAKPGSTLNLRVKLAAANYQTEVAPTTVAFKIKTSSATTGTRTVRLTGQAQTQDDEEDFGWDDEDEDIYEPESLDEMLYFIKAQPRNDNILRTWHRPRTSPASDLYANLRAPGTVTGSFGFTVAFGS
jgi:hypothetical protein